MSTFYLYALGIGVIFLLLSFILDGLSDLFQGLSFFDTGFDILPGILPLTPLEICAFLSGFGGMGYTLYSKTSLHLLFALLGGIILSLLTNRLVTHLKRVDSEVLTENDLIGMEGKVIVTIFKGGIGSVALNTKQGKISYSAESNTYIKQGSVVKVIDVHDHILVVSDSPIYFLTHQHY